MEGTTGYPNGRKTKWVLDLNENAKYWRTFRRKQKNHCDLGVGKDF